MTLESLRQNIPMQSSIVIATIAHGLIYAIRFEFIIVNMYKRRSDTSSLFLKQSMRTLEYSRAALIFYPLRLLYINRRIKKKGPTNNNNECRVPLDNIILHIWHNLLQQPNKSRHENTHGTRTTRINCLGQKRRLHAVSAEFCFMRMWI